jgi:CshA-type fibril repeat protein
MGAAAMLAVLPGVGSTAYQLTGQGPTPNWVPSGSWNGAWDGKVNSTRTVTNTLPSGTTVSIGVGGNASVASRYGDNSGFFTLDDHGGWRANTYVDGTTYLTPAVAISNFCKTPSSNAADYDLYNQSGGWCTNNTLYTDNATLTIAFSKPVTNPVINLAGVGGFDWRYRGTTGSRLAENTMRLWTEFTLTTPGATLTQLTTNPGEFEVDVTGKRYKPSGTGATVSSYCITGNNSNTSEFSSDMGGNAGCGSFRINGTGSTFTFQLDYNSVNGVTAASTPTTEFERLNNLTTDDTFIVSVSLSQDYGSAPASYDTAPTYHSIGDLYIGGGVTADALAALTPARDPAGDNETNAAFKALPSGADMPGAIGSTYSISVPVTASAAGKVCGWVDWDVSGTYDSSERVCETFASGTANKTLSWTVPVGFVPTTPTWLRLRASYDTTGVESPVGALNSGEIEDYELAVAQVVNNPVQTVSAPPSPTATPDAITTPYDTNQTYTPLANDFGATIDSPLLASTVKLCDFSQAGPPCELTTLTVANQGTYTVNSDGTVLFDPLPTFVGTATAIIYQAADSLGRTARSTITPTITPAPNPVLTPDTSSGPFNTAQTMAVLANDTNNPAALDPTTVKLCQIEAPADTAPDCTLTTLTTVDGVYSVDAATGVVTFTPVDGFLGEATVVVTYSATDVLGRKASTTYTPTVLPVSFEATELAETGFNSTLFLGGLGLVTIGGLFLLAPAIRTRRS